MYKKLYLVTLQGLNNPVGVSYNKSYVVACTHTHKGHWYKFVKNPNLRTCRGMIRALENILREVE